MEIGGGTRRMMVKGGMGMVKRRKGREGEKGKVG